MNDWKYRHHVTGGGKCGTKQLWKAKHLLLTVFRHTQHDLSNSFPKSWRVGNTRKERPWRWNRCGSKSPDAACSVELAVGCKQHYRLALSSMHCIIFVPYLIIYFSLHTMNRSTSGASLIGLGLKKKILVGLEKNRALGGPGLLCAHMCTMCLYEKTRLCHTWRSIRFLFPIIPVPHFPPPVIWCR